MNTNRRKFLTSTTALTASAAAASDASLGRRKRRSAGDGRLQGHRLRVPVRGQRLEQHDHAVHDYAQYAAMRTAASNVAITQAQLLQFTRRRRGSTGSIRRFAPLAPTYTAGKLAVIANAGTLIAADDQGAVPGRARSAAEPVLAFGPAGCLDGPAVRAHGAHGLGRPFGGCPKRHRRQRGVADSRGDFGLRLAALHDRHQDGAAGGSAERRRGGVRAGDRCRLDGALQRAAVAAQHRARPTPWSPARPAIMDQALRRQRHGQSDPDGDAAAGHPDRVHRRRRAAQHRHRAAAAAGRAAHQRAARPPASSASSSSSAWAATTRTRRRSTTRPTCSTSWRRR